MRRRLRLCGALSTLALAIGVVVAPAQGSPELSAPSHAMASSGTDNAKDLLREYAASTWESFVAMVDADSGLPADNLRTDGTRSVETSTTNIGAYMWSAMVAERLDLIRHRELVARIGQTLDTLEGMERYQGQFYNWYDHRTGEKLTYWPPTGEPRTPILSSVDNGWLATGLRLVSRGIPQLAHQARTIYDGMDFGIYYRPEVNRILFHIAPDTGESPCCYDTIVSESRIASYIGIAKGELPRKHYFGAWRSFPDGPCADWGYQEAKPVGFHRTYLGVDVFEGAYEYNGTRVVPGWGGSMFEALMPALFVPEDRWGKRSWRVNHPLTVAAQIHHGLVDAEYGYWGFSPANIPEGGYDVYGVDALGMNPDGYFSNEDRTGVDRGFPGCEGRDPQPDPEPEAYTNGVVTPHAVFLALRWAPKQVVANLERLRRDFDVYTDKGFLDSVNVDTGAVSPAYLSLDQGIIMAAIGNALAHDFLRELFTGRGYTRTLAPLVGMERFNASPRDWQSVLEAAGR